MLGERWGSHAHFHRLRVHTLYRYKEAAGRALRYVGGILNAVLTQSLDIHARWLGGVKPKLKEETMNRVLNLQRLAMDETYSVLGSSTGSSTSHCCNNNSES